MSGLFMCSSRQRTREELMKQVLVPIALVRVFQQCSRESVHVPEHPPCEAITNVRFGSNADIRTWSRGAQTQTLVERVAMSALCQKTDSCTAAIAVSS